MSRKKKQRKTLEELLEEALVPAEEQPYEVPENWVWVRLSAVDREKVKKRSFDPKKYPDDMFELYSVPSFPVQPELLLGSKIGSSKQLVEKDDVLLCKINPRINRVWIVNKKQKYQQLASTEWIVISPEKNVNPKFLLWALRIPYFRSLLKANVSGVGGSLTRARPKEVMTFPFPLPPLSEQKRIVHRVESLLGKIEEAKQLIEEARESYEQRRAAILAKAFRGELTKKWREQHPDVEPADKLLERIQAEKEQLETSKRRRKNQADLPPIDPPYELPKGWRWVRLGEIIFLNPSKPRLNEIEDNETCSFVPMGAVDEETGRIVKMEERPFNKVRKGYTYFKQGDVLFAKITPCMENGKAAIAENLRNGFGFGSTEFHVLRTNRFVNHKLIYYLVRSKAFRDKAKTAMTGAVGQQRVPKAFLEEYIFPLPPLEEQQEIVSKVESLLDKGYKLYRYLKLEKHLTSLTQSILTQAFRGELGTHDPEEESALELLKEVLAEKNGLTYEPPREEIPQVAEQGELYLT